jgi:hypothetical protein
VSASTAIGWWNADHVLRTRMVDGCLAADEVDLREHCRHLHEIDAALGSAAYPVTSLTTPPPARRGAVAVKPRVDEPVDVVRTSRRLVPLAVGQHDGHRIARPRAPPSGRAARRPRC